ncbi:MAG: cysteine rich repeat-containing protein [Acetobacteraceae bacterium]|nr:cysteine rich repeat-containing protein [Acetobacteraceae bacterium]
MKTSTAIRSLWLAGLALAAVAGVASAQQPTQAQSNAIKQACRTDYQAKCASVPTGGKAALQCLQEHLTDLSPACQTAVNAVGSPSAPPAGSAQTPARSAPAGRPPTAPREEAAVLRRACGQDYRAYCQGVPLGGGRAIGCLKANAAHLSPSCQGALSGMHGG